MPLRPLIVTAGLALISAVPAAALAECQLSVVNVSFGAYDTLSALQTDITGSINMACDAETSVQISLSSGLGTFAARQMQGGGRVLLYNLYIDPTRLSIWGDGSPGTSVMSLSGTNASLPVYGRIPAHQNVPAGSYGDTITVTLTF
jgi:spore coat protein U-like protein